MPLLKKGLHTVLCNGIWDMHRLALELRMEKAMPMNSVIIPKMEA
jgi:hypothetical protein